MSAISILAAALTYAARGLRVVPCHIAMGGAIRQAA